ncbi:hypothetical protein M407DRAFT_15680 [Tulasnella calospora MUT 4182]|uniref:Probable acetate kinase n=1 Tax=Tulasnella calospora MUT 4182 TaxID=1051891 RepID=A0A0C3Q271_9AGAM|nr:hypothetical protein M407DRAFT_15680 [Tulasnella calospora MUT 4182]
MKTILAVNCGSSSIKFKLYTVPDLNVLISGQASSVATKGAKPSIKYVVHDHGNEEKNSEDEEENMPYEVVFERIVALIDQSTSKHFQPEDAIAAVSHRVVHGGTESEPMEIYPGHTEGLDLLDKLSDFAPLHNHRAVEVVKFCLEHLPNSRQILCFDTLFHHTLLKHVYTYPLAPPAEATAIPLRKYGAHGLSYAYILGRMSEHLQKPQGELNLIIAHLGSGASMCLIKEGKSFDTTMGLTPLEGLPGGTRTGSLDPALIFHHTPSASEKVDFNGFPVAKAEMIMNKEGGLQALCGTSNFGTIASEMANASSGDSEKYRLAYQVFLDRILNYLGAYLLKLFGSSATGSVPELHGLVFSGGIGERSTQLRADVGNYLKWLKCEIDEERNREGPKNDVDGGVKEVTKAGSGVRMFDEESQTANMALNALRKSKLID